MAKEPKLTNIPRTHSNFNGKNHFDGVWILVSLVFQTQGQVRMLIHVLSLSLYPFCYLKYYYNLINNMILYEFYNNIK